MHQQRAIGRHGLGDGRYGLGRDELVQRQHAAIGVVIDGAAEFDRDGGIAGRQDAGRGESYGHGVSGLSLTRHA